MKKINLLILFLTLISYSVFSQSTLLAQWTFPTGTTGDSLTDGGNNINVGKYIHTVGGTSAIDFSKNGFATKSAQAIGWDNGNESKYWEIEISTTGYDSVLVSSRQQSGGANPGPRDFLLQYKVGVAGSWNDVDNGEIKVLNDWTTGVLNQVILPVDCENQTSVYLRWLVVSDTASNGTITASSGISKIDNIYVYGRSTANLPVVTTDIASLITNNSAVSGGNVTNDGGSSITVRGVCWSTDPNPTISDDTTSNGSGTGTFTSNITGLSKNTTYYVRAYATNSTGTAYGNEISFQTKGIDGIRDQAGNNLKISYSNHKIIIQGIKTTDHLKYLKIVDASGKEMVLNFNLNGNNEIIKNVGKLKAGVYFIILEINDNIRATKLFVN
jgi:hypothetical protein